MEENNTDKHLTDMERALITLAEGKNVPSEVLLIQKLLHWAAGLLLIISISTALVVIGFLTSFGFDSLPLYKKIAWSLFVVSMAVFAVIFEVVYKRIRTITEKGARKHGK